MAGPEERYGDENETAPEIAADDAGVSATAERLNNTTDQGDGALSDGDRPMAAMASRHERFAGSAVGVESIGFGEQGVYTSADGAVGEDEELLLDGQEEVFWRTEVEQSHIEHHAGEDLDPFEAVHMEEARPAARGRSRPEDVDSVVVLFPQRLRRRLPPFARTAAWFVAGALPLSGVFVAGQDLLRGAREASSVAGERQKFAAGR